MTHKDNLNQAILSIASKKASTDSSQSRHLEKMGTRYSGRASSHYQYTFPNEQNHLTVPGFVKVDPATNLISQYLEKLIKPKKKTEVGKDPDKADSSSDTYNKSRQIVSNLDIENYKLRLALAGGALNQAEFNRARKFNRIDAAKKSKELEVPSIETANESTTESHMNNILKNKIKNQCYKVLSEKFYDMFLESPQSGGAFAPGRGGDPKRGPNAKPIQKEADKKETEAEEERKRNKGGPGVDPVEPDDGGGGTQSKEPMFPPLVAPVPDSVAPAPTGGGTVGGGKVTLPTGETEELRDDDGRKEIKAPPLAGEPYEGPPLAGESPRPGQTDFRVGRPRSKWTGLLYDFAYGPGNSEALSAGAGLAQNLTSRPGPNGGRVWAMGPNAGKNTGAGGHIAPLVAAVGTGLRTWDTVLQNADDPEDMVGEVGDLWLHSLMDLAGYNTGKAIGGGLKKFTPRKTESSPGEESPLSVTKRELAAERGLPLPAKTYVRGTAVASKDISHTEMVQQGLSRLPDGKYGPAGIFEPVPDYTGFSPVKIAVDKWNKYADTTAKKYTAAGVGIPAGAYAVKLAIENAKSLSQPTGSQPQGEETRVTRAGNLDPSQYFGVEANDWYSRWLANRETFGKVGVSPIGGAGLDIRQKNPLEQDQLMMEPSGKFKEYPR